eukprot:SAG22_NODE_38_length_26325_cov_107.302067_37_plen_200_part_00
MRVATLVLSFKGSDRCLSVLCFSAFPCVSLPFLAVPLRSQRTLVAIRATIKKGRSLIIKLGDKEVDYDPNFQLYLQTKLSNPHYIPEVQAQCTMVNFTVTELGLEDQLLALVVGKERPDLEAQRAELIQAENDFKVQLSGLGEATLVLSLKGSDHCLSFCFSAFPCGSTALTADTCCNQRRTCCTDWPTPRATSSRTSS